MVEQQSGEKGGTLRKRTAHTEDRQAPTTANHARCNEEHRRKDARHDDQRVEHGVGDPVLAVVLRQVTIDQGKGEARRYPTPRPVRRGDDFHQRSAQHRHHVQHRGQHKHANRHVRGKQEELVPIGGLPERSERGLGGGQDSLPHPTRKVGHKQTHTTTTITTTTNHEVKMTATIKGEVAWYGSMPSARRRVTHWYGSAMIV